MQNAIDAQLSHKDHRPASKRRSMSVVIQNFSAPANVGAVFRSADAFGVECVYLCGSTVAPPNTKLRRLSRAAEKYVPYQVVDDAVSLVQHLKSNGMQIISLEITSNSLPLANAPLTGQPLCLILGTEDEGVAAELLALSDLVLHIPMCGHNSSLNVGSACAVALYELAYKSC